MRQAVLQMATSMGDQLTTMAAQLPPAADYLDLRARQQDLLNQALALETAQLQLIGNDGLADAAAAITGATRQIRDALATQQRVARDAGIAATVIAFVAAVLAGRPGDILATARGVAGALKVPGG